MKSPKDMTTQELESELELRKSPAEKILDREAEKYALLRELSDREDQE